MEYLQCKCGNDTFHTGTNGKFAMCSKCHTTYNDKGEEVEIKKPFKEVGDIIYLDSFICKIKG